MIVSYKYETNDDDDDDDDDAYNNCNKIGKQGCCAHIPRADATYYVTTQPDGIP